MTERTAYHIAIERKARIERLRKQIKMLRNHAWEGHMPYVVDALELIVDLLEQKP